MEELTAAQSGWVATDLVWENIRNSFGISSPCVPANLHTKLPTAATSQLILTIRSTHEVQLKRHNFTVVLIKCFQLGLFGACRLRRLTSTWLMFENPCQTLMVSFFQYKCMFLMAKKVAKPLVVARQLTLFLNDCGLSFSYLCATYQCLIWTGWRWASSHDATNRRFRLLCLRRLRRIETLFLQRLRDSWLIETQYWLFFSRAFLMSTRYSLPSFLNILFADYCWGDKLKIHKAINIHITLQSNC